MIVLTTGPGSLARLMRRDTPLQPLAARQVQSRDDQGEQDRTAAQTQRDLYPPRF